MVDFNAIQAKIDAVLTRSDLKNSNIGIDHYVFTTNEDGEEISTFDYQEVVEGIILNYEETKKRFDVAGLYNGSSYMLLLPSTANVSLIDKIYFKNSTFVVSGITKTVPNDVRVLLKVFVTEE